MRQWSDETFVNIGNMPAKVLMITCTDDCVSKILRDQIIEDLQNGDTIEKLRRQKKLSLEQTIQICRAHESATNQREEIKGSRAALNVTSAYKAKTDEPRQTNGSP